MHKDRIKTALKGLGVAALIGGMTFVGTGCQSTSSCGNGSCGDKQMEAEHGESSCGKGSCGKGSCGGAEKKDK